MNNKLEALLQLAALLSNDQSAAIQQPASPAGPPIQGQHIAVLDRGFVYVGDITIEGDFIRIRDAKNIRKWGTTNGLGELRNGPLPDTKLDTVGEVLAPLKSLIHFVPCKGF